MTPRALSHELLPLRLEIRHETIPNFVDLGCYRDKSLVHVMRPEHKLRHEGSGLRRDRAHCRSYEGCVEEAVPHHTSARRIASLRSCGRLSEGYCICGFD